MARRAIVFCLLITTLSGCVTTQSGATGASAGYTVGAIAGSAAGPAGTLAGAGIGLLVGSLLGYAVDKQQDTIERQKLGAQLQKVPPSVPGQTGTVPPRIVRERVWVDESIEGSKIIPGHFEDRPVVAERWNIPPTRATP